MSLGDRKPLDFWKDLMCLWCPFHAFLTPAQASSSASKSVKGKTLVAKCVGNPQLQLLVIIQLPNRLVGRSGTFFSSSFYTLTHLSRIGEMFPSLGESNSMFSGKWGAKKNFISITNLKNENSFPWFGYLSTVFPALFHPLLAFPSASPIVH